MLWTFHPCMRRWLLGTKRRQTSLGEPWQPYLSNSLTAHLVALDDSPRPTLGARTWGPAPPVSSVNGTPMFQRERVPCVVISCSWWYQTWNDIQETLHWTSLTISTCGCCKFIIIQGAVQVALSYQSQELQEKGFWLATKSIELSWIQECDSPLLRSCRSQFLS
jgi:hypothetical protein